MAGLLTVLVITLFSADLGHSKKGCPPGKFGWECKFLCACQQGSCDQIAGACESGCKDGKYGFGCQLENKCLYDSWGVNYTGTLNVAGGGEKCVAWSHPFVRQQGYYITSFPQGDNPKNYCRNPRNPRGRYGAKPWCYISTDPENKKSFSTCDDLDSCKCPDGLFGKGCTSVCHCHHVDEVCDKVIGICSTGCAVGWTGLNCQQRCPLGTYGKDCLQKCGKCFQDNCHPEHGECLSGCESGYRGLDCMVECPSGRFGRNCVNNCGKCNNDDACNSKTGVCFSGCSAGYRGDNCNNTCTWGRYGPWCGEYCGYCKSGTTCDPVGGECLQGCAAGKMGNMCDQECLLGKYGENCSVTCGSCKNGETCLSTTGQCMNGCSEGFLGYKCVEPIPRTSVAYIAAAIAVATFTVLAIGITLCLHCAKKERKPTSRSPDGSPHNTTEEPTCAELGEWLPMKQIRNSQCERLQYTDDPDSQIYLTAIYEDSLSSCGRECLDEPHQEMDPTSKFTEAP